MRLFGKKRRSSQPRSKFREWTRATLWAVGIIWVIKTFVFNWTVIDSTSMRESLEPGNFVIVNKLGTGGRLPVSPIAIPFTDIYANVSIPAFRFPGFSDVERNDLVVFNDPTEATVPIDRRTQLVKRIIGLPGDTVEIKDRRVYVNGKLHQEAAEISFNYLLELTQGTDAKSLFETHEIIEGSKLSDHGDWLVATTPSKAELLRNDGHQLQFWNDDDGDLGSILYPFQNHNWTTQNYGPVIIPKAGMTVEFTPASYALYMMPIGQHEGKSNVYLEGYYIENEKVTGYTFEKDYYFVLGDNRDNAADSRFWGFLPEDHVVGTVGVVLW